MAYRPYPPPTLRHPRIAAAALAALVAVLALAAGAGAAARAGAHTPDRPQVSTSLVVNEIDYDQPSTDNAEFVELLNVGSSPIDLDPYSLELVNGDTGGATVYRSVDLPGYSLAAGDHYVVCGVAANVPNCDLELGVSSNLIQNGAPDAVAVVSGTVVVDTVSYEGDTGSPYTEGSGSGLVDDGTEAAQGLSRYPDGTDSDQNNQDLSVRCISPGETNRSESENCDAGTATVTPTPGGETATPESPTATAGPTETPPPPTETPAPGTPTATIPPPTGTTEPPSPSPVPPTATPDSPATATPEPLAVTLERFTAERQGAAVLLRWTTASEIKHAGFHVLRESPPGTFTRLTRRLLPPSSSPLASGDYRLLDLGAPAGPARYWLDDLDVHGTVTRHGPVLVPARARFGAASLPVAPEAPRRSEVRPW